MAKQQILDKKALDFLESYLNNDFKLRYDVYFLTLEPFSFR